jgi:hypothetical protein
VSRGSCIFAAATGLQDERPQLVLAIQWKGKELCSLLSQILSRHILSFALKNLPQSALATLPACASLRYAIDSVEGFSLLLAQSMSVCGVLPMEALTPLRLHARKGSASSPQLLGVNTEFGRR